MFWQRRNETRVSHACKVGQLGLEQLDARVVPSSMGTTLAPGAVLGNKDLVVKFDEFGHAWAKVGKGNFEKLGLAKKDGTEAFKLPVAVKEGDVKVFEPKDQKDDHNGKGDHKGEKKQELSDILRFVTKDSWDWKSGKMKQESWLIVYSDKEEKGEHEPGNKADVGLPKKLQDNTAKAFEKGKEGFVDYDAGGKGKADAEYLFYSDKNLKPGGKDN